MNATEDEGKSGRRLIHIVASNRWSGVERYALDLCRHFRKSGWSVDALTRDAKAVDNKFSDAGIPLRHAPLTGFFDLPTVLSLARLLRKERDKGLRTVIHVHRYRDALRAIAARRLAGRDDIRIVMTLHNVIPGRDSHVYRYIYRNLDAQIFVSERVRSEFISTWKDSDPPFKTSRLHTILNSLSLIETEPLPEPEKGPVIAMYHGRLTPGKGLETLIRALSMIAKRTLRLRIVGSGNPDYVDSLRHLAQTLGVMESIDWRKHVDDPLPLIADSHFGILPSEEPEAFGLSNLEYMASGRPVVTTTDGGQAEYLTDGTDALLVAPGNPEELADAMRSLSRNPDRRREMGLNANRTLNERLSWKRFASEMEKIYNSL